jgi:predicted DNA-binding transcriptional regulator AlpA
MSERLVSPAPMIASVGHVCALLNKSKSTISRLERDDPDFPRSFKLHPKGDRQWIVSELAAWVALRAGRGPAGGSGG